MMSFINVGKKIELMAEVFDITLQFNRLGIVVKVIIWKKIVFIFLNASYSCKNIIV